VHDRSARAVLVALFAEEKELFCDFGFEKYRRVTRVTLANVALEQIALHHFVDPARSRKHARNRHELFEFADVDVTVVLVRRSCSHRRSQRQRDHRRHRALWSHAIRDARRNQRKRRTLDSFFFFRAGLDDHDTLLERKNESRIILDASAEIDFRAALEPNRHRLTALQRTRAARLLHGAKIPEAGLRFAEEKTMVSRLAVISAVFLVACGGETLAPGSGAADGGTPIDSGTPVNTCISACIDGELAWAPNGGLDAYNPSSSLSGCSAYDYDESSESGDLSCTDTLSTNCNASGITAGDVAGAFYNPDVTAAFAGSTKLYGSDPRGCDGEVLQITYQGKTIAVGGDCSHANDCGAPNTSCVAVPAGLGALADLLESLDEQEIKTKNCASVFPGR
jgi:hypothetical protein